MTPVVTLYTKDKCVQCNATKMKLAKEGVDYSTVDLSPAYFTPKEALASTATAEDIEEARRNVEAIREMGYMQMPVIVVSREGQDDVHWSGHIPDNITAHCKAA